MKISKRQKALKAAVENLGALPVADAVSKLKKLESNLPKGVKPSRFDQSVGLAVRLGVDPKHADQIVRGSIVLPNGIGKSQRVLVFCKDQNIIKANEAGADFAGGKELADKIKEGWMDFDVAIATPDMMGVVGPLGKLLGPRGLMPSPKAGTVTQDVTTAVKEYKAGKVEFRVDDGGNIHCVVGKMSFSEEKLTENIQALLQMIMQLKPQAAKGQYVRSITVTATQMPGIQISAA
ncbi:50S ribosomal protein L1 [Planctomicrobium piriforme]|uniref:Large ribosomal subunit protein uL1 n=1 Tax=Planctomicrobium piriforme TaxID=1576369 RepID=A0A1I3B946_9PLAN|nr:50S ribosomal protein L1 [Planctomicrobium piriforme]SFH58837.1 large subunit ribosomal protein L1 [Planctomicrobium piriforme]